MFFWHGKKAHLVRAAQPGPGAGATFCCLLCWPLDWGHRGSSERAPPFSIYTQCERNMCHFPKSFVSVGMDSCLGNVLCF